MKKWICLTVCLLIPFLTVGCGQRPNNQILALDQSELGDTATMRRAPMGLFDGGGTLNVDQDGVFIHGYDVVAYHTQRKAVRGSEQHEVQFRGATFRFASERHKKRFKQSPKEYLPEFGGFCSLGMANGYKDGMLPEAFEIVHGRLYFNLTPGIHEHWNQNRKRLIERAEQNWPRVKDSLSIGPGIGHP